MRSPADVAALNARGPPVSRQAADRLRSHQGRNVFPDTPAETAKKQLGTALGYRVESPLLSSIPCVRLRAGPVRSVRLGSARLGVDFFLFGFASRRRDL